MLKASGRHSSQTVLQLRGTAQFYLENKGKYIFKVWGHADPKDVKRRERERECARGVGWGREREKERDASVFWLLFYVFFPRGLPYVNWASQECPLFYLRSLLQS